MDTLRHLVQVWPGFDKKLNFLPSANKAKAAQVQLLFVCDFWHRGSFHNRAGMFKKKKKAQWKQAGTGGITSSDDESYSYRLNAEWLWEKNVKWKSLHVKSASLA